MLQLQVLTDRQLESRTSLGDTNLTIGSSSFEGTLPAAPSTNLTNGAILDTEEELAEAGSYIRSGFWSMSPALSEFSYPQATEPAWYSVELDGYGEREGEVADIEPGVECGRG